MLHLGVLPGTPPIAYVGNKAPMQSAQRGGAGSGPCIPVSTGQGFRSHFGWGNCVGLTLVLQDRYHFLFYPSYSSGAPLGSNSFLSIPQACLADLWGPLHLGMNHGYFEPNSILYSRKDGALILAGLERDN